MVRAAIVVTMVCSAAGLAACSTSDGYAGFGIFSELGTLFADETGDPDLAQVQQDLRNREREYSTVDLTGAVLGATVAGLVCIVEFCDPAEAALAMMGGAVAGLVGGNYLAREHSQFEAHARGLEKDIALAKFETEEQGKDLAVAEQVLRYHEQEVHRLNTAYAAGLVNLEAYRSHIATAREDLDATRKLRRDAESRITRLAWALGGYGREHFHTGALHREWTRQRQRVQMLYDVEAGLLQVIEGAAPEARELL